MCAVCVRCVRCVLCIRYVCCVCGVCAELRTHTQTRLSFFPRYIMLVRGWLLVLQDMNGKAEDGAAEGEGEGREYDVRANRPASWQPSVAELAGARELAVVTATEDEESRRGALLRKGRSRSMSDEDDLRDLLDKYVEESL